jgi:hypothetical protein
VVDATQETAPKAKIPTVALPAAEPRDKAAVAAVADALTSPEYVYLLRVVVELPIANMPTVEFPAAAPTEDTTLEAVPEALTQPEYVYLLRVVEAQQTIPKANIPTVELPAAEPP